MKKLLLLTLLLTTVIPAFAQQEDEDSTQDVYELRGREKYGYIVTDDDKKVEGIVKLLGKTNYNPWVNQKKVKFIPKDSIDASKKRQRFEKLKTDDLKEYVAYIDDSTQRHFKRIKYTNARTSGLAHFKGGGIGSKIGTVKNLSATENMAEIIVEGKITMYCLYGYPTPVAAGAVDVAQANADREELIKHPTILYQKEDGKIKELYASDIKDLVDDCKMVSDKLAAGQYKTYDPSKEEKKRGAVGKFMKGEMEMEGTAIIDMGIEIFSDYNANCK